MDEVLRQIAIMERCTLAARRALWHARNAVQKHGGTAIDLEHLVLGLMAPDVKTSACFAALPNGTRRLKRDVGALLGSARVPASESVPMAEAAMRALEAAWAEADAERSSRIQSRHLLVAVLTAKEAPVADLLRARGLSADDIRQNTALNDPDGEDG